MNTSKILVKYGSVRLKSDRLIKVYYTGCPTNNSRNIGQALLVFDVVK